MIFIIVLVIVSTVIESSSYKSLPVLASLLCALCSRIQVNALCLALCMWLRHKRAKVVIEARYQHAKQNGKHRKQIDYREIDKDHLNFKSKTRSASCSWSDRMSSAFSHTLSTLSVKSLLLVEMKIFLSNTNEEE